MIDKNPQVGRYICLEALTIYAPYFIPKGKITRISGKRIYFMDKHNEEEIYTMNYYAVCDIEEECKMLQEFTTQCLKEIYELKENHQKMAKELFTKEN